MNAAASHRAARDQRLIEGVIAKLPLLSDTSPSQLATVARQCWIVTARRGDSVAARGAPLPGVFALAYGSLKLVLGSAGFERRVLRLVAAGQTFGEATAFLGRAASYDALALVESKLVVIPARAIYALIDRDPRFARAMLKSLAERKLELLDEIEAATLRRSAQRLASYLESLAGTGIGDGPVLVKLPVSKTTLASRLGIKKETLSRLLRRFAADGLIEVSRGEITIRDRARLAETAGSI